MGNTHPQTLGIINNLGVLLHEQGKLSEAEQLFREALTAQRGILGDTHQSTLGSIINLAIFLNEQNRFNKAEQLLREASKSC